MIGNKLIDNYLYIHSSNGSLWCMPAIGLSASNEIIAQCWNAQMMAVQGPIILTGVWTHIVTSYSITNGVRLWVDGTLIGSSIAFSYLASGMPNWITLGITPPAGATCATGNVSIGQFYGMMDEVRIYSREITASDIATLANP
jgi:hypothetical protein